MDDGAALLAAIVAHPDDDTPRLVYADYIEERGEDARAELIRVQCAIARTNPAVHSERCNCAGCKLRRREAALLAEHGDAWRRVHCRGCGGKGWHRHGDGGTSFCQKCGGYSLSGVGKNGTGDATRRLGTELSWHRGWCARMVCPFGCVFGVNGAERWARDIARAHPLLTEWRITDRYPRPHGSPDGHFVDWTRDDRLAPVDIRVVLPSFVWDELATEEPGDPDVERVGDHLLYWSDVSIEAAVEKADGALARGAGRIVRRAVQQAAAK